MPNYFNIRPDHHEENDPRIERLIMRAAVYAASGKYTTIEVVELLMAEGAQTHEAVNAARAGRILASG